MRAGLIVTSILGLGTAVVFAAAALTAALFPSGTMISAGWNGGWGKGGIAVPMPAPMVQPAIVGDGPVFVGPDGKSLQ